MSEPALSAQQEAVAVLAGLMGSRSAGVRLRAGSKLLDLGYRVKPHLGPHGDRR